MIFLISPTFKVGYLLSTASSNVKNLRDIVPTTAKTLPNLMFLVMQVAQILIIRFNAYQVGKS